MDLSVKLLDDRSHWVTRLGAKDAALEKDLEKGMGSAVQTGKWTGNVSDCCVASALFVGEN